MQYLSRDWCNKWAEINLGSALLGADTLTDSELAKSTLEYMTYQLLQLFRSK